MPRHFNTLWIDWTKMNDLHHVFLHADNQLYLDDIPLKGVKSVEIVATYDETPIVKIELYCNPNVPDSAAIGRWTQARVVREAQFKEIMTKQANELLEKLSENQS